MCEGRGGGRGGVCQDDDDDEEDTDDREEDKDARPLSCHPGLAAVSESTGGSRGNQSRGSSCRVKVKRPECVCVCFFTCDCFVRAPQVPAESPNLILCDPVIMSRTVFLMFVL